MIGCITQPESIMPFIRITVPDNVLDDQERTVIAERMTIEIMKIETDGHDTPGFRAISALVFDLVPPRQWAIGGVAGAGAAAVVEIRVPEGALTPDRRKEMIEASYRVLTSASPALAAVDGVRRVWTHVFEVVDWGAGGHVITIDALRRIAGDEHAAIA